MNDEHYAIVIGLSNYPKFTDPPANLRGPVNDEEAVRSWLTGVGGLRADHVWSRASPPDPTAPEPTRDQLEEAFDWLEDFATRNENSGRGRRVGRRLYIHIAGHGFSPMMRQGCLLAGNASPQQVNANISVSAWLQWLQDADYFREYVLLMDCCMNRVLVATPTPAPFAPIVASAAPSFTFVAFAAQRPLKAVEVAIPEDGGKFHGVFTWAFLKGLEGAAVNRFGVINGHSMANWLRNAIYPWLTEDDRADPDVSKQPEIVAEDAGLIFRSGVVPLTFKATLEFPVDAVGKQARLWSGVPLRSVEFTAEARTERQLPAGLHVVEVADAGYRQGFEIVRDEVVSVTEKGPEIAVADPGAVFPLNIETGDVTAEISVVGADFETVIADGGRLAATLPVGIYKTVVRVGRQLVPRVLMLDRETRQGSAPPVGEQVSVSSTEAAVQLEVAVPRIASAVPFRDAINSHEYQADAALESAQGPDKKSYDKELGTGAELMIMARSWSQTGQSPTSTPWEGVVLVGKDGQTLVDLSTEAQHHTADDPFALCRVKLAPGTYYLRHPFDGHTLEQSLVVSAGWRLEAYLLRRSAPTNEQDARPRVSLLMRALGQEWGLGEDERVEKARVALADERPLLGSEVQELLVRKFSNPLEGILGAHLLLLAREAGTVDISELQMLNEVVSNLRSLIGDEHPDVEALSLACPDAKLRRRKPIIVPPIYERSWRLLVEASYTDPSLVPVELWRRQLAQAPVPPFLVWSVADAVRETYETALVEAAFGRPSQPVVERVPSALEAAVAIPGLGDAIIAGGPLPAGDILPEVVLESAAVGAEPKGVAAVGPSAARVRMLQLPPSALSALRSYSRQ